MGLAMGDEEKPVVVNGLLGWFKQPREEKIRRDCGIAIIAVLIVFITQILVIVLYSYVSGKTAVKLLGTTSSGSRSRSTPLLHTRATPLLNAEVINVGGCSDNKRMHLWVNNCKV
eukprot:1400158-Pyramimonas_sp.AAC.1